jgi:hypothetical protein
MCIKKAGPFDLAFVLLLKGLLAVTALKLDQEPRVDQM